VETLEPSHGGVAGKEEGYSMCSDAIVHRSVCSSDISNMRVLFGTAFVQGAWHAFFIPLLST
jgi:hypothetical protein